MGLWAWLFGLATLAASQISPPTGEIEAHGPSGPLKGVLAGVTGKPQPFVLLIPGSGPTDRDGNNPLGVKAATYRLIAEGLAQRGIASVRIDKRGMFGSAGAVPDANAVTLADYVSDTSSWIAAIRQRTGVRCVWLLGHSEGGLVALASAAQQQDKICGLLLVSTAGRPLGRVLREQLRANPENGPLLEPADRVIDELTAGRRVDPATLPVALSPLFRPQVQGFLISTFAVDPAALITSITKPVMIMQGQRDIQVSMADAQMLKSANRSATLIFLPDTNHVLKQVTSDSRSANIATYADPNLPLAPGVIAALARFINTEHSARHR